MNRQKKIIVTVTYNDLGCIIDTKAEPYEEPNLQQTCNQLATDTISRQAAIDTIRAMQTYKLGAGDDILLIDQAEAQTELMMFPSAQPEPHWIPCSERLPDEGQEVLWTDESGEIRHVIKDKCGLLEFATYEEMMHVPILAWMPLPEPYKERVK